MDYSFFKRRWFTNYKRTKKDLEENLIKKESESDFSKN